jgi:hypothetical protein
MRLEIIIKDKGTGEVIQNTECDSVICGFSGSMNNEDQNHSGTFNAHRGSVFSAILAIEAVEHGAEEMKKEICSKLKTDTGADMTFEEIKDILSEATTRIEIDEDAIKAMMEAGDDEHE